MSGNTQLKVCSFGFAMGLIWGLGILLLAWLSMWCAGGWGAGFIKVLSSVYTGYAATWVGGLIGGLWGFVDFFIFGALVAWVYNSRCCCQ